ncbi:MAG: DUF3341 domain-containing protein [Elusimicrobia bacterium]|nr:DUF3341 domain-containing protein [Elusimicrobiota bacterium]
MAENPLAVLGLFKTPKALLEAVPELSSRGLGRLEAYTPYPIHGLSQALGLRRTPLAGMVMVMGAAGTAAAFLFQWWMNAYDYPLVTGGKPLASWQAFVPIMFEVTVLFASFTAWLGAVILLCRLPKLWHPVLGSKAMPGITCDRFALSIEAENESFDSDKARQALVEAGASDVELVIPLPEAEPASLAFLLRLACAGTLAAAFAGLAMYWTIKLFPLFPPMSRMLSQPKLDSRQPAGFFADAGGAIPSAPGAVARGRLPYPFKTPEEAAVLADPLPRDMETLRKGRAKFDAVCKVCHGPLADGKPTLTKAYGATPADLQAARYLTFPDGSVFHTITKGKNSMPSFSAVLTEDERWQVVQYLRALQRARNAKDSDLP